MDYQIPPLSTAEALGALAVWVVYFLIMALLIYVSRKWKGC